MSLGSRRLSAAVFVAVVGLAGLALYVHNPVGSHLYPPCLFHVLTGLYCPGCGSLRALHQLTHGHLMRALDFNPLLVAAAPALIYHLATQLVLLLTNKRLPAFNLPVPAMRALVALIVVYWLARNIPVYPFTWLAP